MVVRRAARHGLCVTRLQDEKSLKTDRNATTRLVDSLCLRMQG